MLEDALDPDAALPPEVRSAAMEALAGLPGERAAALAAVCTAHPEHADALGCMLEDLVAVERLLDGGDEHAEETPAQIGPYRVVRRLGGGAFGQVFRCEQQEPVRREVAVKVLRAGAGDRTTLLRFASERQLIASLQHPAIAQVFDAGTLADGRPFFVMDAIDGLPIDRYCDERGLTVEARIELFCDLCRGVQHAHERGIVHRDLKPANVLVVEIDGRPRPKVIDFGIAKVLQGSRVPRAFDTEAGRVVGTPGYMSPEQQRGESEDVDARADVFGLGVMLYELLCGQLPWAVGAADTDTDAQRPSTRVSSSAPSAAAIARQRSSEPRRLAGRLRGELDWIVLKCLQRERGRRYQTAQELIDDLERHRRSEPVRARPPAIAYRLKKFEQRHRAATTALVGTAVVAVVALVLAQQYRRSVGGEVDAATARAASSFADAAAAVATLVERANDPAVREAPQGDVARQAMLRDALLFYDRFLRDRPGDPALLAERCRALLGMTQVCWLLGDSQRATDFAKQAIQDGEAAHAADLANIERQGALGEAMCRHGIARALAGDRGSALTSFRAAMGHLAVAAAALPAKFGSSHVSALRGAAAALPDDANDDRMHALREALRVADSLRAAAPRSPDYVLAGCDLAAALRSAQALPEARAVLRDVQAALPEGADERLHLACRVATLRARFAFQADEKTEAIEQYQVAVAAALEWERAWPKRLLPRLMRCRALRGLAYAQNYLGDFDSSATCFREAISIIEGLGAAATANPGTEDLVVVLEQFAVTLFDRFRRGVLAEAKQCIDRAVTLDATREGVNVPSQSAWRRRALQAAIADSISEGGGNRHWPGVEATMPADPTALDADKDRVLGVFAGLARWHLDHGRSAAARAALDKAEAWIVGEDEYHAKRVVEVGWLTARLAAANGDDVACAKAADRVLAARPTWYGRRRAADCLHLAWRTAGNAAGGEALVYRDRAVDLYRQVMKSLAADVEKDSSDPWFVLPWAIASVRAAELAAATDDAADALALLAAALPRLDAVRAEAHADQWDEQAWRDGTALRAKLTAAGR